MAATIVSGSLMRPVPASPLSPPSRPFRTNELHTVFFQCQAVALRCQIIPHGGIHCRCNQHRNFASKQHSACQIIGNSICHFGHSISGQRRNNNQIRIPCEPNMFHVLLIFTREKIGKNMIGSDCANGQRRYELLCCCRHQWAHLRTTLTEATNKIRRLIRGNSATDNGGRIRLPRNVPVTGAEARSAFRLTRPVARSRPASWPAWSSTPRTSSIPT